MVVVEATLLDLVSTIAREMNLTYSYRSFTWDKQPCVEIISSSKPFLAVLVKRLEQQSEVLRYFINI